MMMPRYFFVRLMMNPVMIEMTELPSCAGESGQMSARSVRRDTNHRRRPRTDGEGKHPYSRHDGRQAQDLKIQRPVVAHCDESPALAVDGKEDACGRSCAEEPRGNDCAALGGNLLVRRAEEQDNSEHKLDDSLLVRPASLARVEAEEDKDDFGQDQEQAQEVERGIELPERDRVGRVKFKRVGQDGQCKDPSRQVDIDCRDERAKSLG